VPLALTDQSTTKQRKSKKPTRLDMQVHEISDCFQTLSRHPALANEEPFALPPEWVIAAILHPAPAPKAATAPASPGIARESPDAATSSTLSTSPSSMPSSSSAVPEEHTAGPHGPYLIPRVDTPAVEADKQVHVADDLGKIMVARVIKHYVYSGAAAGSLHNVYVRIAFSNAFAPRYYMPAAPLLGSRALRAYLDTNEGAGLIRYIPSRWSGLHQ